MLQKTQKELELENGEEGVEEGEEREGGGEEEGGVEEGLEEVGKREAEDGGIEPEWQEKVEVGGAALEVVTEFRYLGRILSQEGGEESEIQARVKVARQTLGMLLAPMFGRSTVERRTKLAVYRAERL